MDEEVVKLVDAGELPGEINDVSIEAGRFSITAQNHSNNINRQPWHDEVDAALEMYVLPIIEQHLDGEELSPFKPNDKGISNGFTTKQQATAFGAKDGARLLINWVANYWPEPRAIGKRGSTKENGKGYTLGQPELNAIPGLIAKYTTAGDAGVVAKLMSIKEVHDLVGRVSFEDVLKLGELIQAK